MRGSSVPHRVKRDLNYSRHVAQFLCFIGQPNRPESLVDVRPHHVAYGMTLCSNRD